MFRILSAILFIVILSPFGLPGPASAASPATIISPTNGSTLSGPTMIFSWNTGVAVSQYFLYVGTSVGANNLYGQPLGLGLSATVTGLPTNGSTIYVRLWSDLPSGWQFNDYTYTAAKAVSVQSFLTSPLAYSQGAYTPGIMNSVLDHSMKQNPNQFWQFGVCSMPSFKYPYCTSTATNPGGGDGVIMAFNGETANGAPASITDPNYIVCITGQIFLKPTPTSPLATALVNVKSTACNSAGPNGVVNYVYSSYDEHPGYDFVATMNTSVKAAAQGFVVNNGGTLCVPTNIASCATFNYVGVDHGNGYITQYGHLSIISVTPGQHVAQGQQIGLSGDKGVPGSPHLHFEVIKVIPGHTNNYNPGNYAVVDPYGWVGSGTDPLYSVGLGIPSTKLWQ